MLKKLTPAKSKRNVLIASHRGCSGGNIIQNTIPAFENALLQGADILEMDVIRSTDGEFFLFHTDQEKNLLEVSQSLDAMDSRRILGYSLHNSLHYRTVQKVNRLDDVLEQFKGRCLINLDRSWSFFDELIPYLDRFQMRDQIILKGFASSGEMEVLEGLDADYMYMPIIRTPEEAENVCRQRCRTIGMELVFQSEDFPILREESIQKIHAKGWILWANAINLNDTEKLDAGHDDMTSMFKNTEDGWGWLVRSGFDVIQTDWPMLLSAYLQK